MPSKNMKELFDVNHQIKYTSTIFDRNLKEV